MVNPPRRCNITMIGFSNSVTVHIPSIPWKITSAKRIHENNLMPENCLLDQAKKVNINIIKPNIPAR